MLLKETDTTTAILIVGLKQKSQNWELPSPCLIWILFRYQCFPRHGKLFAGKAVLRAGSRYHLPLRGMSPGINVVSEFLPLFTQRWWQWERRGYPIEPIYRLWLRAYNNSQRNRFGLARCLEQLQIMPFWRNQVHITGQSPQSAKQNKTKQQC